MKLHPGLSTIVRLSLTMTSVLALVALAAPAPAQGETLCVRARNGAVYAVGEGFSRQACRDGDREFVAAPKERGLRLCTLEARAGMTTVSACSCAEGEVVEMVGEYASSPADLVYDLATSPASASLGDWDPAALDDYRMILAELTSGQNGTLTLAVRCAAE